MFFGWIRRQVRSAVLAGINDAVDALDTGTDHDDAEQTLTLRLRLVPAPALPGEVEAEPVRRNGRKASVS